MITFALIVIPLYYQLLYIALNITINETKNKKFLLVTLLDIFWAVNFMLRNHTPYMRCYKWWQIFTVYFCTVRKYIKYIVHIVGLFSCNMLLQFTHYHSKSENLSCKHLLFSWNLFVKKLKSLRTFNFKKAHIVKLA